MPPISTMSGSRVWCDAERFVQLFDRKRRVGVHPPVAFADARGASPRRARSDPRTRPSGRKSARLRRSHQITRRSSSTFASGRIVRISKIEIIGRKRRNRNSSVRNRPIVPTKVDQSQNVG